MWLSKEGSTELSKLNSWGDAGKQSEPDGFATSGFAYLVTNMLAVPGRGSLATSEHLTDFTAFWVAPHSFPRHQS